MSKTDETWVFEVAWDCCGLDLTPEQVQDVLAHTRVKSALATGGHDTVSRECVADYLASTVLGCRWPTYSQGGFDVFLAGFLREASNKGYKLAP